MEKERIAEFDIIKGICIIGIVFSHAGHELMWLSYIFLFGFYFVGGATYRDKPLKNFFLSKMKRIYVPFVISNIFGEFICCLMRILTKYGGGVQFVGKNI